jgi:hypothetical protein
MDFSLGALSALLRPLLSVAKDEWSKQSEFKTLRHLAYERLSRELHWNAECLWKLSDNSSNEYIEMLRTEAFDSLVTASVPLDFILFEPVRADWLENEPYSQKLFRHRIEGCNTISELVDKVYNRLWMLKNKHERGLSHGDLVYLINLLLFTLAHINIGRRDLHASRASLRKQIALLTPEK